MKKNKDQQAVSDILKKLQASYLGGGKNSEKKKKEDDEDLAFRNKLAAILGKASDSDKKKAVAPAKKDTSPKKAGKSSDKPTEPAKKKKAPTDPPEKVTVLEPDVTEPVTEEPIAEETAVEEPVVEEPVAEEPAVEEPIVEETIVEETIVEETIVEETIVEETIVEEPAVEEPIVEAVVTEESPLPPPRKLNHPLDLIVPLEQDDAQEEPQEERNEDLREQIQAEPKEEAQKEEMQNEEEEKEVVTDKPEPAKQTITIRSPLSADKPSLEPTVPQRDPESIVIRPRVTTPPPKQSIVIQPRTPKKTTVSPQVVQEEISQTRIKIGKEVPTDMQRDPLPTASEPTKATMKKESNVTFVPPSEKKTVPTQNKATVEPSVTAVKHPSAESAEDTASKKASAPKPAQKRSGGSPTSRGGVGLPKVTLPQSRAAKKAVRPQTPVHTQHPEDEKLEEVLDEAIPTEDLIEEIPMDEPEEIPVQQKKLSIFQRHQQQKQLLAEQKLPAMEVICRRSGLSEDDVAMMFELGYENELGKLVGYENLKRMKSEHMKKVSQTDRKQYRTAFGYRGEEFADNKHTDAVMASYLHDRKRLIVRLLLTVLLSVVLFFAELPHLIGGLPKAIDTDYPLLFPLLSLLLFMLTALLSKRQISAGLRSLFRYTPTPYSVCAILPPFVILYDVLSLFTVAPMLKVNLLASLSFVLIAVCDVLRITCEMKALTLISTEEPKHVLAPTVPRKKKLRRGDKIVKIITDDIGDSLYQARSCKQTVGFFRRFNKLSSESRQFMVLIVSALSLSTLLAFASAVYTSAISVALSTFMSVLTVSLPLTSVFVFFYPLSRANRLLGSKKCTLLGEESVVEYNQPDKTVIFPDTRLFSTENATEISARTGTDFRNDLYLAAILFRKLGGTLEPIGRSASQLRSDPPVSIVRIQENGVEAMIDNKRHLLVGSAAFLRRGGIRVPPESTDRAMRRTENVSLMYVAVDGALKLSYEIEYRADQDFEAMICELAESGATVAINTYDPNLNEEFLQKCRPDGTDPVRVVKPGRFEEEKPLDIADVGAVALGDATDLAYPLHAARGIFNIRRFGFRIQLIASLLGSAAILLFTLLGKQAWIGILPIAIYQLFWIVVSFIASRSELNGDRLHFK